MLIHGVPKHIRSDNGPEFTAREVWKWLSECHFKTVYINPGALWENAYAESFNSRVRDELLKRYPLQEILCRFPGCLQLVRDDRDEWGAVLLWEKRANFVSRFHCPFQHKLQWEIFSLGQQIGAVE